jgi:hypothetical protein
VGRTRNRKGGQKKGVGVEATHGCGGVIKAGKKVERQKGERWQGNEVQGG